MTDLEMEDLERRLTERWSRQAMKLTYTMVGAIVTGAFSIGGTFATFNHRTDEHQRRLDRHEIELDKVAESIRVLASNNEALTRIAEFNDRRLTRLEERKP